MAAAPARADPLLDDDLAHHVDRAAALAGRHPDVDAFEVRGDVRHDRHLGTLDGDVTASARRTATALGIQVFAGGGTAHVHTTTLQDDPLPDLLARGVRLARVNGRLGWRTFKPALDTAHRATYRPDVREHPADVSNERILELASRAEAGAREVARDCRVQAAFGARTARTLYVDSAGSRVDAETLLSTLRVSAVSHDGQRLGDGTERRAGERGLGDFEDRGGPEALGRDAARWSLESLEAVGFPAGRYRVLCSNHLAGTLAHESFGHLTEYDLVGSGWSTLRGRRREKLAADHVSVSDAPTVEGRWKEGVTVPYDDQGTPGRKTTMLRDGVLEGWMHTRDSAAAEGDEAAGNGRALDARFPAIVRMRNTYFEPGDHTLEEAIEALDDGIYLIGARGGAPYSDGSFMFTAIRGYLVENGEVTKPVRSTAIHGNVLDFLQRVELVTKDFEVFSNYFGGCGKADQSFLHVGVGGPHVLVDGALTGGQGT